MPQRDLFIADTGNNRIRRLEASSGTLTSVLGDGVSASSGQGAPSSNFPVASPQGLACDRTGNVFATSVNTVRLLAADERGVVDGSGHVLSVYGEAPRAVYPATVTQCLTGIISVDDTRIQFADSCAGMLIESQYLSE